MCNVKQKEIHLAAWILGESQEVPMLCKLEGGATGHGVTLSKCYGCAPGEVSGLTICNEIWTLVVSQRHLFLLSHSQPYSIIQPGYSAARSNTRLWLFDDIIIWGRVFEDQS